MSASIRGERPDGPGHALCAASARGDRDEVVRLLDVGVDVNARDEEGCTALMRAAYSDQIDVARLLLARGAALNACDRRGTTALMSASLGRSLNVARLLLDRGADIDARDASGANALEAAMQRRPAGDDPDAVVEFCEVIELLQAAHIGICI